MVFIYFSLIPLWFLSPFLLILIKIYPNINIIHTISSASHLSLFCSQWYSISFYNFSSSIPLLLLWFSVYFIISPHLFHYYFYDFSYFLKFPLIYSIIISLVSIIFTYSSPPPNGTGATLPQRVQTPAKGRTNIELREQFILADGVSQSMTAFKAKTPRSSTNTPPTLGTAGPITKVNQQRGQNPINFRTCWWFDEEVSWVTRFWWIKPPMPY